MDLKKLVIDYFAESDKSYAQTYELYCKAYNFELANIRRFDLNKSIANFNFMMSKLQDFGEIKVIENNLGTSSKSEVLEQEQEVTKTTADLTNPAFTKLLKDMQHLYNKKAMFCNSLHTFAPHQNDERALVVGNILGLKEKYNKLSVLKKHYLQFNEFPNQEKQEQETKEESKSLAELRLHAKNLHSNLSKARKALSIATTPTKEQKYKEKIAKLNTEVNLTNKKIKLLESGDK